MGTGAEHLENNVGRELDMALRFKPNRGSHLPVLMKLVAETDGPILELGSGLYSTTPLHWACWVPKRRLVTYESNPEFFDFAKAYETEWHEVHCIDDWDAIDISEPWTIAFVDHAPDTRRKLEVAKLTHAQYVVCHDSEGRNDRKYGFSTIRPLYKYEFEYRDAYPHTTIFSNFHDVTGFLPSK